MHSGEREIKRLKEKKLRLKANAIDSLFGYWQKHDFLGLSNDSLNVRFKETIDAETGLVVQEIYMMPDGCSYQFEIITQYGSRFIYAYEPEEMMRRRPNPHNELFIRTLNEFNRFILE